MRDRILGCVLIALCGLVYWGTMDLPPPTYEPIGPAALPRLLAIVVAVLSLPLVIKPASYPQSVSRETEQGGEVIRPTPWMAVALMALSVVFAMVMQSRMVPFSILATAYLVVVMGVMTRFRRSAWLVTLIVSPVIGFGLEYIFTHIFIIDLP